MDYQKIYNQDYFQGKNSFFYALGYGRFAGLFYCHTFAQIKKYVKKIKKGKVLDIGCAYGFMLKKFPSSWQKFGLDVSDYALTQAQKKLPQATFINAGAEDKPPFKKNFFDFILLTDVLEHLENPELALKNAYQLLKRGGLLYLTTPNLNWLRKKVFSYPDQIEHHISLFSHQQLKNLLKDLGFQIVDHWTFIVLLFYLKFKTNFGLESAFIVKK